MRKNLISTKYFFYFICLTFLFQIPHALAAREGVTDLSTSLKNIYGNISIITVSAAGLMLVLGAIYYMTSAGDKNRVAKARKYLEAAVVALLVVASAYLFFTLLSPDLFK